MAEPGVEEITLTELLQMARDSMAIDIHTTIPCQVDSWDADSATVKVTPALNRSLPDGDGNYISEKLPQLGPIPVQFPRVGKSEISFPIEKGDYGAVHICERNIGAWRSTGNQGDPGDVGTHTLDGAFFVPGLNPDKTPPKILQSDALVVGSTEASTGRAAFKQDTIELGVGATKGVVREGDEVDLGTWKVTTGVGGFILTIEHTAPGAVVPTVLSVATPGPFPLKGESAEGSTHIKADD